MTRKFMLILVVCSMIMALPGGVGLRLDRAAAQADVPVGACAGLTAENYSSAACDAEIAAHPLPALVRPVTYDPVRDGEAEPRSFLWPEEPLLYPVGWQRRAWYFSDAPGVLPADDDWTNARRIGRAEMFYVYKSVEVNGEIWHLIGPGRWMHDEYVSALRIPDRPDGVSGQWVALDLNQQTLIAFVDDTPVFSTLISSGYYLDTTLGLFQVYARADAMVMRGPPGADPPKYEFYTRWVMFFNMHQGLHAMPYHNYFGIKRSHGCVNVPPGDEEWLWNFFEETVEAWDPSGTATFAVDHPEAAPWVYVYESPALPVWP
ncbi:MAG: L,D-transpeptidase [Anaerolineae bacterium]|nr:L,D-transpeptidase [Anaerolineae bacterium]